MISLLCGNSLYSLCSLCLGSCEGLNIDKLNLELESLVRADVATSTTLTISQR